MYKKKLRALFTQAKEQAEDALDEGDRAAAAQYYDQAGDILARQAEGLEGERKEQKQEQAQQFHELAANLRGESDSLQHDIDRGSGGTGTDEDDLGDRAERFREETSVTWDDVAGLDETKEHLKESFALAAIQDKPAGVDTIHSILLYGPPGTGKTLLASAVAGSHDYPFFNVQVSQALSKFYGESGKILSSVFDRARDVSPSIVFFDEIDALAMERGGSMDEPSRRVLSTLLTELSGLQKDDDQLMVITATNAPWDIDPAILSRMERVIYVPLPDRTTAEQIIRLNTVDEEVALDVDPATIAERCVDRNFSGREVKNLCKEAIRHMVDDQNPQLEELSEQPTERVRDYELQTRPLTDDDFSYAFDRIDPKTSDTLLQRYQDWEEDRW